VRRAGGHRLRVALLAAGGFVAALLLAGVIAMYTLLQPERFTEMLEARAKAAGLELTLSEPASPSIWPKPGLELQGMTLRSAASSTPLLVASRGELVLPWRALLGGETTFSRLELDGARIDLDAVSAYVATLPERPSTAGAFLPQIDAGFRISRGTLLRGNRLVLSKVEIDAGRLANGRPFDLTLAASTADDRRYRATIETRPVLADEVLTLNELSVKASSPHLFDARLKGTATWRGAADVGGTLQGQVQRENAAASAMTVAVTPANQEDPLYLALRLDGSDLKADLRVAPLAVGQWWDGLSTGPDATLPPLLGTVDAGKVEWGSVKAEGLQLRATPNVPVPAASVSAPAASRSAP
jgi:hypothetical protein